MANDAKRRRRQKGRSAGGYLGIPHYILRSPEFAALGPWALKLLIEMAANYAGKNNGDLSAAFSVLKDRGWNSPSTLNSALKQLLRDGWLIRTRQGGKNRCALYALTWWPVDPCAGKWLEVKAEEVASHAWKKTVSVVGTCSNVVGRCSSEGSERAA